ncbi:hypothetical protein QFC24_006309 [Naganishia onofrii]|uniref:Uncharacterized protein n=1 Tax=Naganishia onofrii TaxID=1851511 RepID=A0ACC2X5L8_9TREE|nr:hypothetical protein QFC24_006309 [Naganishia onofrii]
MGTTKGGKKKTTPKQTATTVSKAASKRKAAQVLVAKPAPVNNFVTLPRILRARPVFQPILADNAPVTASRSSESFSASSLTARAGEATSAAAVSTSPGIEASQQAQNIVTSAPSRTNHTQENVDAQSPSTLKSRGELDQENRKMAEEISRLREIIATGTPVAEIAKPEIAKTGKTRIAPLELSIGLVSTDSGDPALKKLRKRMLSWIWDAVHDAIFLSKVENKIGRHATFDQMDPLAVDELISRRTVKAPGSGPGRPSKSTTTSSSPFGGSTFANCLDSGGRSDIRLSRRFLPSPTPLRALQQTPNHDLSQFSLAELSEMTDSSYQDPFVGSSGEPQVSTGYDDLMGDVEEDGSAAGGTDDGDEEGWEDESEGDGIL